LWRFRDCVDGRNRAFGRPITSGLDTVPDCGEWVMNGAGQERRRNDEKNDER
jgi:hypothetical protein